MKKIIRYAIIVFVLIAAIFSARYFIVSNKTSTTAYTTQTPFITTIIKKTVAAGKVLPENQVEIKPQISGIIQQIFIEEGAKVQAGDLLAKIKVVPNEQALNSAKGRIKTAQLALDNATKNYNRNKTLFNKGVIASIDFQATALAFANAKQELSLATKDYQIIKKGSSTGSATANTAIRATVSGTVLELPIKVGDQVIESNNFNAGTTIAKIADLSKMIFEGSVEESEVSKLQVNTPLKVNLGAIADTSFDAVLTFVAPQGVEEQGAVKFKIKADITLDKAYFIRAGYSANASIVLEKRKDVLAIKESLLQYDIDSDTPYVEVRDKDGTFQRKDVVLGISDAQQVQIISGISKQDAIKVWNPKTKDTDKKTRKKHKKRRK